MPKIKLPNWARLILIVLLVQGIIWLVVTPLFERTARPVDRIEPSSFEVAVVASPDWEVVRNAKFEDRGIPYEECCASGYRAIRVTFELDEVPDSGIAEIPIIGTDNYQARINGTLHYAEGRMDLADMSYHGRAYRGFHRLPSGLLRKGSNELIYTLVSEPGSGGYFAAPPPLGEYNAMEAHFSHRRFMLNDYLLISMVIGYLIALIAFFAWWRSNRQPFLFWFGALSGAWAFGLHQQNWTEFPFSASWLTMIGAAAVVILPVTWINLINSWIGRKIRFILPVSLLIFVTAMAVFGYENATNNQSAYAEQLTFGMLGIGAFGFAALLLWKLPVVGREHHWEFAIFFACATFLLRDSLDRLFDFGFGRTMDYMLPILLVALTAAFLSRNIKLFRSSEEIAGMLKSQLDERTAELALVHDREKRLLTEQAHQEERQRIMRDMHDGLGSNLMSMLLSAKRGIADPPVVADGLQAAIDEMRLLIDSMDMVGESLAAAFSLFRQRAESRVAATGFAFQWNDHAGSDLPDMSPHSVLQIFRILQEALTNALKHSSGDSITIDIWPDKIALSDNGKKLGAKRRGGHGLDNMRARAKSIGADFDLSRKGDQTVVTVTFPRQPSKQ